MSGLQAPPQADGSVPLYTPLSLGLLGSSEESVMQALSGIVQDKSCIVCSMVVAVQVPKTGYALNTSVQSLNYCLVLCRIRAA